MARAGAVLLSLAVLSAGCTHGDGGGDSSSASTASTALAQVAVLDCRDSIASDAAVPDSYEELAGAIALPTRTSSSTALQTSAPGGRLRLFAKTGLLVKPGIEFTITPLGRWSGRAAAWWGNTGDAVLARSFRGGPCNGPGWRAYPGGFFVAAPGCVPFEVRAGGSTRQIEVGIGAPCAGQRPPPSPSSQ